MISFLAVVLTILFVLAVFWLVRIGDKPTPADLELEKRLEDEYVYDPKTGVRMTIEQAEKGLFIAGNDNRFKSDAEIESNYIGSEREVEYIVRFFQQNDIPEASTEDLDQIIYQSNMAKQFDSFDTIWLWEYNSEICFVISAIISQYPGAEPVLDHELILLVKTISKLNFSNLVEDAETETAGEWLIVRFPRSVTFDEFKTVVGFIEDESEKLL